jgi:hypothetical protein
MWPTWVRGTWGLGHEVGTWDRDRGSGIETGDRGSRPGIGDRDRGSGIETGDRGSRPGIGDRDRGSERSEAGARETQTRTGGRLGECSCCWLAGCGLCEVWLVKGAATRRCRCARAGSSGGGFRWCSWVEAATGHGVVGCRVAGRAPEIWRAVGVGAHGRRVHTGARRAMGFGAAKVRARHGSGHAGSSRRELPVRGARCRWRGFRGGGAPGVAVVSWTSRLVNQFSVVRVRWTSCGGGWWCRCVRWVRSR